MRSNLSRRTYLKTSVGAVAGVSLAGCLGGDDGNGDELILGVDLPWAPFTYRDEDGEMAGIDIEVLTAVFEDSEYDIVFEEVAFDTFVQNLRNGDFDVFASSVSPTEEREEQIAFSDPHIESWHTVGTIEETEITSVEGLRGETMAVQSGTLAEDVAREQLGDEMLDGDLEFDTYDDMSGVMNALMGGQAVATVSNDITLQRFMVEYDNLFLMEGEGPAEDGHSEPPEYVGLRVGEMAYGFRQDDQETIDIVNEGLEEAKESGLFDEALENHIVTDI